MFVCVVLIYLYMLYIEFSRFYEMIILFYLLGFASTPYSIHLKNELRATMQSEKFDTSDIVLELIIHLVNVYCNCTYLHGILYYL